MKALDLKLGDRFPHPLTEGEHCRVLKVETYGRKKMGTDIPMVRVYLVDGPKVVKWVEVPGDREVAQP